MAIEIRTNTPEPKKASKAKSYENALIKASSAKVEDLHVIANKTVQNMGKEISREKEVADIQAEMRKAVESIILQKHQERLAYNAAYQRDLRTIKRLGLSVTVAEWRKHNEKT